ncbi:MAG: PHP domain-containing protein [archaeon]
MKKYNIHLHTKYSHCSNNDPKQLLEINKALGFDGMAVTDHNTIKGALEIKKLNKDKNFEVIVGEEVSTELGHVLVYYVKKEIKPGKAEDIIREAHRQGAICALAHPYNLLTGGFAKLSKSKTMRGTLSKDNVHKAKLFDAIEGLNARCLLDKENKMATKLAKKHKKPIIAGSDGHFTDEIGNAWVEFNDKYTLKEAILKNKITIKGKRNKALAHKLRSTALGWFK